MPVLILFFYYCYYYCEHYAEERAQRSSLLQQHSVMVQQDKPPASGNLPDSSGKVKTVSEGDFLHSHLLPKRRTYPRNMLNLRSL